MSTSLGSYLAALVLAASVGSASPQVPDAGPDKQVAIDETCTLAGRIKGRRPLVYWMADGNGRFEDMLVRYHDKQGVTGVGPLRMVAGKGLGWPGDLVLIDGRVHGVDVGQRRVYVVDLDSGLCLSVTPQLSGEWKMLQSLAHDADGHRLFAYDPIYGQLLSIALGTGVVTRIDAPGLNGRTAVRSLAFEPELGLLYAVDSDAEVLVVVDPERNAFAGSMELRLPADSQMEELQFFEGELYGLLGFRENGELASGQLLRINIRTGGVSNVGPRVPEVSPHALLIESVPRRVSWQQVAGPADADLEFTSTLETSATFPELGTYVFELTVYVSSSRRRRDRVEVQVVATDCNSNGVPDHEDIARGVSLDRNSNGVPDDCELARGYVTRFEAGDGVGRVGVTVVPRTSEAEAAVGRSSAWLRDAVLLRARPTPFPGVVFCDSRRPIPFELRALHPSLRGWGALALDGHMVGIELVLGLWQRNEREQCVMPGAPERDFRLRVSL